MIWPEPISGWQVYGKTKSGSSDDAHAFGWYVCWANKGERTVIFAHLN